MDKNQIMEALGHAILEHKREMQSLPNQYIVAYFKTKDDSLIGYHLDSFCSLTQDIFLAKRYNGEDPYPQLAIISKNLEYVLRPEHTGFLSGVHDRTRDKYFHGMKPEDLYMDAIYLDPDMPKQDFKFTIINNEAKSD